MSNIENTPLKNTLPLSPTLNEEISKEKRLNFELTWMMREM